MAEDGETDLEQDTDKAVNVNVSHWMLRVLCFSTGYSGSLQQNNFYIV